MKFKLMALLGFFASLLGLGAKQKPAPIGPDMRLRLLRTKPAELKLAPSKDFPHVFGVLMDWPMDNQIVTVVGLSTGDGSLYTTSTFGIIGGIGHETVRAAAKEFVHEAERSLASAKPAAEYPYPKPGRMRFYFLTFEGVKVAESPIDSLQTGKDPLSKLNDKAQRLIGELRLVTEKRMAK